MDDFSNFLTTSFYWAFHLNRPPQGLQIPSPVPQRVSSFPPLLGRRPSGLCRVSLVMGPLFLHGVPQSFFGVPLSPGVSFLWNFSVLLPASSNLAAFRCSNPQIYELSIFPSQSASSLSHLQHQSSCSLDAPQIGHSNISMSFSISNHTPQGFLMGGRGFGPPPSERF